MPIPVRETFPTDRQDLIVQVTDDGSLTLVRAGSDDAFHSGCGAASETRHVYLRNSGVLDRLRDRKQTRVLEIGLGTSMAMLMTLDAAVARDTVLEYVAIETDWISAATLEYLKPRDWTARPDLVDAYLDFRRSLPDEVPPGTYRWRFDARRTVVIEVSDVRDWSDATRSPFDAIYYDPFCCESAPELWTSDCFRSMRRSIRDTGKLTTYSCSRPVRDALEQAGWQVQRVPGPVGGKREVIIASPV
ncbi:tRNA 5-methylaminomethyl-2-thiouridine biosynthesis bifunctional protein MnmC [Stieleria neptunia]|uniref:tRNA 5-methylaminomethyl-2-thiouridine biosynthesis bifunctional protein MnmC n=1 Tax=Stieleria neptunia TaxID=2527979 RepID=A0A518HYP8_9BACT|nr:tRNA (5-methylaminomethyl-2-thiouridine)(34)-methyltransferase MnmD [Stieleria neptunia]QDV45973.1 tRNA 5-methylaminomethyl-2-thiouridine biosynthesis bifunctional protein MnmC [Stieleria neptunia]